VSDVEALADEYWRYFRSTAQLWNIDRGDVDQIEHWEDLSPGGVADRVERLDGFEQRAGVISSSAGERTDRERALLAAVSFSASATASTLPSLRDLTLVAAPFNVATFLSVLVPGYSLATRGQGEGYVTKLRALPSFLESWTAGLRHGAAGGRVATARGVRAAIAAYDAMLGTDPADDPLASQSPPEEASAAEAEAWRADVIEAVRVAVRPAIGRLRTMLHDELLPVARSDEQAGVCHLPDGASTYEALLRAATSTSITAEAVHELGLEQLALLDEEYRAIGPAALGTDDPAEIRDRLRSDQSLGYATADEIVADAVAALARAQAEAPNWFAPLPRAACTVLAVHSGPVAYYTAPAPDGGRGGTFFVNVGDPGVWTRYQLEVATFHEAVPGHHLQLAIAQELDLHPVLGELEVTGYGEGWGLYAERLADEMGLYSSPLQRIGMLTLDSLRAARLVVDTGIHALGWTRDDAVDVLLRHTAQTRGNAEQEIDRYIADPGQATSYMVGRLEIQRMRRRAESRLGSRFSPGEFHGVVLGNGMTPLDQLARTVDGWTARKLSEPA
jgi:uncharacterized protein (DUF885 family)